MLCGRMDVHCMICISGKVAIQNHGDFIKKKRCLYTNKNSHNRYQEPFVFVDLHLLK